MKAHTAILLISMSASVSAGTFAPDISGPPPTPDEWEFRLGLPLWVSGLSGDAGILGRSANVDLKFEDVLTQLKMAAALSFEARKGSWGIVTSGLYINVANTAGTPGPLLNDLSVGVKQLMLDGAVTYSLADNDRVSLEALAGARYLYTDLTLDINGKLLPSFSAEKSETWVDPYVGLQGHANITKSLSFMGRADIGGFGVGSDLAWQLFAGFEYQINPCSYANIGYRYLSMDYKHGGYTYNVAASGPQIELGFKF